MDRRIETERGGGGVFFCLVFNKFYAIALGIFSLPRFGGVGAVEDIALVASQPFMRAGVTQLSC